jgi:hypothetical protein
VWAKSDSNRKRTLAPRPVSALSGRSGRPADHPLADVRSASVECPLSTYCGHSIKHPIVYSAHKEHSGLAFLNRPSAAAAPSRVDFKPALVRRYTLARSTPYRCSRLELRCKVLRTSERSSRPLFPDTATFFRVLLGTPLLNVKSRFCLLNR